MVSSWKSTTTRIRFEKPREKNRERTSWSWQKTAHFKIGKVCLHTRWRKSNKKAVKKKFLYHKFKQINVQFIESKFDLNFPYKVEVKVSLRDSKIELEKKRPGRFILATNVLDKMELTTEEMLYKYNR